jgi:hypothetical protein
MTHSTIPESAGAWCEGREEDRLSVDIVAAMASATTELAAIARQLEPLAALQERARRLEAFIRLGKVLLGEDREEDREEDLEETAQRKKRTSVEHARHVLETFQRPMRTQEMADYVEEHGLMQGSWTREVLRTAMRTHPEDFECISKGLYVLREWPSIYKRVPDH